MPKNFQNITKNFQKSDFVAGFIGRFVIGKETRILDGVACKDPSLLGFWSCKRWYAVFYINSLIDTK